jgi:hypothetical protein
MTNTAPRISLKEFVEKVIDSEFVETFITNDEEVEIIYYRAEYSGDRVGVAHFEYHYRVEDHTASEQSGEYSMDDVDYVVLEEMSQELFNLPADQVQGYVD